MSSTHVKKDIIGKVHISIHWLKSDGHCNVAANSHWVGCIDVQIPNLNRYEYLITFEHKIVDLKDTHIYIYRSKQTDS